ncbi:MAG: DUF4242 domain-containing protein [Hyphomicrobium sp.]|uniref:DUF4242 domain-containing protein n=1 Tax=Hyphomicrobium sp. TaxID=82 RepID=UPI0039E6F28A
MKKYIIERNIPAIGDSTAEQLKQAAATSNAALAKLSPDVQWLHSYIAGDNTFCVYLAKDEEAIRKHAELSGFPANRIIEVKTVIDPSAGG